MYRLTRLFLLCVFVSTLVFAQPIPTIDWISPTESAMLHFDSGKWWFDGPSSPDSMFRVNFHDYSELDSSSLWIKISRNGAPLEEITGYYSHFYYDNGDAEGSFGLLGLEPGSYYDLCAHIANIYEMDTIQCVHFYTETVMDSCPPVVIGWNPEPEITCYDGYMSIMICDNSLDCSEITDVDPASVQLMLQIPGHPEMNVTSHTYIHNSGGPHCVEVDFNPTYPCDSLNYLIQPDMNIQFCVTASDYAGNAMPEPVCAFYNVCPDTCPPEVFNPYLSDTMLVFDGTWHISAGDSLWTINFNDNYSECIPTPFDTSTIGLLIRNCDDTSWRFVQATHINIVLDPAYCRLMGTASGSFDDLGLECGHCYEIMAQAGDMYGNIATGYSPVRFHTEECLPDSCDPFVAEWNPFPYDTNCFPYEDEIWFIVEDPSTEFCSCTGVHYVDASLLNNGTTFFLTGTSGLNRIDLGPCLAKFILDPAYYELVPGTGATLTVHGYDGAGGMFWDSLTFTVCDTFTPPVDTCPPYVERWMPNDTACIPVDANIGAMVCDNAPGCDNAGIIPDSITVLVRIGDDTAMTDITEQCYFDPAGDCIMVNWNHTGAAFSYDEDIQLCILAIDNAGNEFYDCNYWHTCALEDTCPPEVSWTTPAEGETLIFDSGQWFADREAYVDSNFNVNFYEFGCPGTGLVDSSLFIRIRACDDTVWTYILDYGIFSSWDYGNASGSFDLLGLEPAHCYIVCAAIMDGAGNWGDDCVTFYTEPVLEDTCPPYVTYWEPFDGDTVDTLAYIRAAYLVDPSSPECIYSGVDTSTYSMIVIINGDTLNVTSELTIYYDEVSWHHDSTPFPPGAHIVVCLDFADYAGNWAHDCIEFEVAGEAPVDECPPVVDIEYPPTGHCIPPDSGHIILDIFDPSDSICFASGVNE
ncbi:hypothetical protein J7L68_04945, partial [bacterium]|nr:hypothetical protein [bacterium]